MKPSNDTTLEIFDIQPTLSDSLHEMEKLFAKNGLKSFPIKLIKPNFIIDLMDEPGDLIPVNSHRAKLYCTRKLREKKH